MTRPDLSPFYGLLTRRMQRARLRQAAPYLSGAASVLDLGCGLTDLPGRLAGYAGCDRNGVVLEENRCRFPGARFFEWDVAAADPPRALAEGPRFEVVLMLALLEHVPDPSAALRRAASLLVPRGRIVATTPHPSSDLSLRLGAAAGLLSPHAEEEHEALLDREALERAAAGAGLTLAAYRRFLLGLNQLAVFSWR